MITAERIALLVLMITVVSYAAVLIARDVREPVGVTRAEILARLADEKAIAEDQTEGRS